MEDHRHEEYEQPKMPIKAFSGKGHMLGRWSTFLEEKNHSKRFLREINLCSPAPKMHADLRSYIEDPGQSCQQNDEAANNDLKVNDSQPVTTIQIRLADGSRFATKSFILPPSPLNTLLVNCIYET